MATAEQHSSGDSYLHVSSINHLPTRGIGYLITYFIYITVFPSGYILARMRLHYVPRSRASPSSRRDHSDLACLDGIDLENIITSVFGVTV